MAFADLVFAAKLHTVRRNSRDFLAELQHNQTLPRARLDTLEDTWSAEAAAWAMRASPFYARLYGDLGVDPAALAEPAAWHELPVLDRGTVKDHFDEIATPEAQGRAARRGTTGGSTGQPLAIMHDARVPTLALAWRMYSWWGVRPSDNIARIGRWNSAPGQQLRNNLAWWPTRQVYLEAGHLDDDTMEVFHRQVLRTRPTLIEGYMGAMLAYADFLESRNLPVHTPIAVATTAAPLTASARMRLHEVFGAPVYDEYRCAEFGWTAGQCRMRDALHVFSDVHRLEVLDEDGRPVPDGVVGDIVITDLRNRVFPLIRYRTGDRGALRSGTCACGNTLPLMEQVDGRNTDVLSLPSGAVLAHRLHNLFGSCPDAVNQFQIHQHADHSITVTVVLGSGHDAVARVEKAVAGLRDRTRGEVPVTIDYADSLPYTRGKVKYIVSDVVRA